MTETVPNEITNKIEHLAMQNAKLKERYEFYKTRFTEITKKTSPTPPPLKSQKNVLNDALISSMQHLESLKREKESYLKSVSCFLTRVFFSNGFVYKNAHCFGSKQPSFQMS